MKPARKLVLVDLDNLLGCDPRRAGASSYRQAYADLVERVGIEATDLVVIGVPPHAAWEARAVAPAARIVTRSGPDGAEIRLLHELADADFVERRFTEVVVASGDHRFVDAIAILNHRDVITTVAAIPTQLSTRLRLVAQHLVWLTRPAHEKDAA